MIVTLADQYLAQNAGRRYPFMDDTADIAGLPDTAVVGFNAIVRGATEEDAPIAMLTTITDAGDVKKVNVVVKTEKQDDSTEVGTTLATFVFDIPKNIATTTPYTAIATAAPSEAVVAVEGENSEDSEDGEVRDPNIATLTVNASILQAPTIINRKFAYTTVGVSTLGVDSVTALNGEELTGDIYLAIGYNTEPYLQDNRIRVDIGKGLGLGEWCQEITGKQNCENILFSINGERPGADGNILISGDGGITVIDHPDLHEIEITVDRMAEDTLKSTCEIEC